MATGLGQQGERGVLPVQLGGVDENHCRVGTGRGCHHVAGVLLMARRVADDELAFGSGEVAIGHIDRDPLLAFGGQAVGEEGQVGFAGTRDAGQLVLHHGAAVH